MNEDVKTLYDLIIERGDGIDVCDRDTGDIICFVDFDPESNDAYDKAIMKICKELHCVSYDDDFATVDLYQWVENNFDKLDSIFDIAGDTKEEEIGNLVDAMSAVFSGMTSDSAYEELLESKEIENEDYEELEDIEENKYKSLIVQMEDEIQTLLLDNGIDLVENGLQDNSEDYIVYRDTSEGPMYLSGDASTTFNKNKAIKLPTEQKAKEILHNYIEKVSDPEANEFRVAKSDKLEPAEIEEKIEDIIEDFRSEAIQEYEDKHNVKLTWYYELSDTAPTGIKIHIMEL